MAHRKAAYAAAYQASVLAAGSGNPASRQPAVSCRTSSPCRSHSTIAPARSHTSGCAPPPCDPARGPAWQLDDPATGRPQPLVRRHAPSVHDGKPSGACPVPPLNSLAESAILSPIASRVFQYSSAQDAPARFPARAQQRRPGRSGDVSTDSLEDRVRVVPAGQGRPLYPTAHLEAVNANGRLPSIGDAECASVETGELPKRGLLGVAQAAVLGSLEQRAGGGPLGRGPEHRGSPLARAEILDVRCGPRSRAARTTGVSSRIRPSSDLPCQRTRSSAVTYRAVRAQRALTRSDAAGPDRADARAGS